MTADEFRALALDLPQSVESAHMNHPDFRVKGKVFATLGPDVSWGMVKLTAVQQGLFMQAEPAVFTPVPGGWGRRGATRVNLDSATPANLRPALAAAWRNVAPKRLVQEHDGDV
jgi:hypothetical protein